jgi:O-antigen/teichoic acid export membrane protein
MSFRPTPASLLTACLSPLGAFSLRFIRTFVLSRLLTPHDMGAAVVLMSILVACELITDVGLDRFVMIADEKTRAQAVAAARQIAMVRAAILAALIALFAPQLSAVFGARQLAGSTVWLGLVPLILSFKNWRIDQLQQEYRYGPEAVATLSGLLAGGVAVVPGFMLWHDYRAILLCLISEAATYVALSHLLAGHERVPALDRAVRRAALAYSLPLMANGACLMLIKQFDQIIVANLFDLATLAVYTLGLNLAVAPASPIQAISQKIGLPFLSNARGDPDAPGRASALIVIGMITLAAAYALPVGLALDYVVPLVYGQHYHITIGFAALAMLCAFLRFCRGGPSIILLQRGATKALTAGNMTAVLGAVAGLLAGLATSRIEGVMAGFAFGDLVSVLTYLFLVRRRVPLRSTLPHFFFLILTIGAAVAVLWIASDHSLSLRLLILLAGMGAIGADAAFVLRGYLSRRAAPAGRWRMGRAETIRITEAGP